MVETLPFCNDKKMSCFSQEFLFRTFRIVYKIFQTLLMRGAALVTSCSKWVLYQFLYNLCLKFMINSQIHRLFLTVVMMFFYNSHLLYIYLILVG